jgi:uncharacterized protein YodC (DUF2158 family)
MSQGTTWMVKGGANDDMQSEGSYMVRAGGQNDDLSSQGSYMVRVGKADTLTDMQSEGSYMVRGFNGQIGNKPIFDDDSDADGSFIRQSQNSFMEPKSEIITKDQDQKSDNEREDTTAKFTS